MVPRVNQPCDTWQDTLGGVSHNRNHHVHFMAPRSIPPGCVPMKFGNGKGHPYVSRNENVAEGVGNRREFKHACRAMVNTDEHRLRDAQLVKQQANMLVRACDVDKVSHRPNYSQNLVARKAPYEERFRRLRRACEVGDDQRAVDVLSDGDTHRLACQKYESDETALHAAARGGAAGAAEALLHAGADVDARDVHAQTPALVACVHGHPTVLRVLLSAGRGRNVTSCLAAAAGAVLAPEQEQAYDKCVDLLLLYSDKGALLDGVFARRPDDRDKARSAPLPAAHAVARRHAEASNVVRTAAKHGRAGALSALVAAGYPCFVASDGPASTPLHLAASSGSEAAVLCCISALAEHASRQAGPRTFARELEWRDASGRTPLACALEAGAESSARHLIRVGADASTCGIDGAPAWAVAEANSAAAEICRTHATAGGRLDLPTDEHASPFAARRRAALVESALAMYACARREEQRGSVPYERRVGEHTWSWQQLPWKARLSERLGDADNLGRAPNLVS